MTVLGTSPISTHDSANNCITALMPISDPLNPEVKTKLTLYDQRWKLGHIRPLHSQEN